MSSSSDVVVTGTFQNYGFQVYDSADIASSTDGINNAINYVLSPLDPGPSDAADGKTNIFVVKYDSNGLVKWDRVIGGLNSSQSYSVEQDSLGNVYVSGQFDSPILHFYASDGMIEHSINLIYNSIGQVNFFVAKYDNNGNLLWTSKFGGNGRTGIPSNNGIFYDIYRGITVDSEGNLYISSSFYDPNIYFFDAIPKGAVDNPSNPNGNTPPNGTISKTLPRNPNSISDSFLAKYNTDGTVEWVTKLDSPSGNCVVSAITIDTNGNPYITGGFKGGILNLYNNNNTQILKSFPKGNPKGNIFAAKYDSNGTVQWLKVLSGGPSSKYGSFDAGTAIMYKKSNDAAVIAGIFDDEILNLYDEQGNIQTIPTYGGLSSLTNTHPGYRSMFLLSILANGDFLIILKIESTIANTYDIITGLTSDTANNTQMYLLGLFKNNTPLIFYDKFGKPEQIISLIGVVNDCNNTFLAGCFDDGTWSWAVPLLSNTFNNQNTGVYGTGVSVYPDGEIYVSGFFSGVSLTACASFNTDGKNALQISNISPRDSQGVSTCTNPFLVKYTNIGIPLWGSHMGNTKSPSNGTASNNISYGVACSRFKTYDSTSAASLILQPDALVLTDEGYVNVKELDLKVDSINGLKLKDIINKIGSINLVFFQKDALAPNYPNRPIYIEGNVKVKFNGDMIEAKKLINGKNVRSFV